MNKVFSSAAEAVADIPNDAVLMAGGFGLLHGFGFAGALTAIGLPAGDIPLALVSFNLGVELGQLAFIGAALLLYGLGRALLFHARRHRIERDDSWWARRAHLGTRAFAYAVGGLACYWTFLRIATIWRGGMA